MSKLTSSRAVSPPNRSVTWSTSSTVERPGSTTSGPTEVSASVTRSSLLAARGVVPEGAVTQRDALVLVLELAALECLDLGLRPLGSHGTPGRQQALRSVEGEDQERQPKHEDPPVREAAEPLRKVGDDGGADEDPPAVALPADHDGGDE